MKLLRRLLCAIGLHAPPAGINTKWSVYWPCWRCGTMCEGELGRVSRRR